MAHTDDILRARLKTLGVSEHRFRLKAGMNYLSGYTASPDYAVGNMMSHDWRIFDVGGARSLVRNFFSCILLKLRLQC